jgi:hypothetical protein
VAFGEEHVPEAELPGLDLELLDDGRVVLPSGVTFANLGLQDGIGSGRVIASAYASGYMAVGTQRGLQWYCNIRDTFFLYKLGDDINCLLRGIANAIRYLQNL